MTDSDNKLSILQGLWLEYETVTPILLEVGVSPKRLPTLEYIMKQIDKISLEKLQEGQRWMCEFRSNQVAAYLKIKGENTAEIWASYKAMLPEVSRNFAEVKELNRCKLLVREGWFTKGNVLQKIKRELTFKSGVDTTKPLRGGGNSDA